VATTAFAAQTTESRYHKLWEKTVSGDVRKPKVGCVCLANGALGTLIFVPQGDNDFAYCGIPTFDQDGSLTASNNCGGAFAVLPK
jgi:hypothetical protein